MNKKELNKAEYFRRQLASFDEHPICEKKLSDEAKEYLKLSKESFENSKSI